ncbi:MAG: SDR family oxidoreductase [Roseiflexaceae bacterium]|jgi:dTDP-4-dehydrorhamnose reductase
MRLYITGGSGYLGSMLVRLATANGWHVRYSVFQHSTSSDSTADVIDLRYRGQLTDALEAFKPDAVIHTAYVQQNPDLHAITVLGAIEAAAASARLRARHIHMSSDMVFAGTATDYDEIDIPKPIIPYGTAKAIAEAGVTQANPEASIVRTSLIYSPLHMPPSRHEQLALDAAAGKNDMAFFVDEFRCPVLVDELANALLILIGQKHRGPLHLVGAQAISRYDFAHKIVVARGGNPHKLNATSLTTMRLQRPARLILKSSYSHPAWRLRGVDEVLSPST